MSAATSPGTGLAYGLRRVCAAWGMARSSFYAMTSGQHAKQPPAKRRGPKPAISDQALLVAIEADLEASPWEGEGYRKVWARLRVCRDIRVARKRVLRLMRENNLLSPHRCRRRGGNPHDGEIITHAPNLMWGTDGVRVFTVDDGWGWIFTAVEHWNAECVGWRPPSAPKGRRSTVFAALQFRSPWSTLPIRCHGSIQFGRHRLALALLEPCVDPADHGFPTPSARDRKISTPNWRDQKLHWLGIAKAVRTTSRSPSHQTIAGQVAERACRQSHWPGENVDEPRSPAFTTGRIYRNFHRGAIGHVPVLLGHFD